MTVPLPVLCWVCPGTWACSQGGVCPGGTSTQAVQLQTCVSLPGSIWRSGQGGHAKQLTAPCMAVGQNVGVLGCLLLQASWTLRAAACLVARTQVEGAVAAGTGMGMLP